MNDDTKNIDREILLFFLLIAVLNFIFYMARQPVIVSFKNSAVPINVRALVKAFLPDLVIFLSFLVPYILFVAAAFIIIIKTGKNLSNEIFMILFFPLFGFFSKSMFLPQIYYNFTILEILKDNFAFFSFFVFGPVIIIIQLIIQKIIKNLPGLPGGKNIGKHNQ